MEIKRKDTFCFSRGVGFALTMLVALAMLLCAMPITAFAQENTTIDTAWYSADGTNYTISTASDLFDLAAIVNGTANGITADSFAGKTITLSADIDLKNAEWTPIGTATNKFCGTFDGDNHSITGLNVNISENGAGLFGVVGDGAYIKNLTVFGSVKTTGKYAGGIVGNSSGSGIVTIENCGNYASVTTGGANAAGIIGCNDQSGATFTITNCYNVGTISGGNESAAICGWLGDGATVENCWNIGPVSGIASGNVFARYGNTPSFTNCFQFDELYRQEVPGITNQSYSGTREDAVQSGQIANLLGAPWGQNLGTDNAPVISNFLVHSGYKDNCKKIYSNSPEGLSQDRPAHDDSYLIQEDQCGVCGEWHPNSIMYTGLDLTEKEEDASGAGWTWTASTKTLTLTNCTISSLAEATIKLPDGATIQLIGENSIASSYGAAKTIYALGSLTIRGSEGANLSVVAAGGHVIFCENESKDVLLTLEDITLVTSGGEIELPKTNKNSSVEIINSSINTNEKRFEVISGVGSSNMSFVMENSSYVGEKLYIADEDRQTGDKMTVSISGSEVKPTQTSGNATDSAFNISAKDLDLDIENSHLYLWTKGWTGQHGNSYAMRLDASGDANINISGSDFLTYGASTGFYIDVCGAISEDSVIENSSIVSYAKNNPGEVHVYDDDSDESGWANNNRRDIFENCILMEYSYMSGQKHSGGGAINPSGKATIIGSPELTRDFILPDHIGLEIELASVTPQLVIEKNSSLTIAEGKRVELPEGITLKLSEGSSVIGNYVGAIETLDSEDVVKVSFDLGDQVNYVRIVKGNCVSIPNDPANTGCRSFGGWYSDEDCTTVFDFNSVITDDVIVYAKWNYSHTWGEWEYHDSEFHIRTCETDDTHTEKQAHSYRTEWESDSTNHWHECECGAKTEEAAHSGGPATCTENAICETCKQPYGEVLGHDWGNWISTGNGTHTRSCDKDANHTETNDCSGGAATCTEKAKCDICKATYGSLAEHTYGNEWKFDNQKHWRECTCGAKTEEAAHKGSATCSYCGAKIKKYKNPFGKGEIEIITPKEEETNPSTGAPVFEPFALIAVLAVGAEIIKKHK